MPKESSIDRSHTIKEVEPPIVQRHSIFERSHTTIEKPALKSKENIIEA